MKNKLLMLFILVIFSGCAIKVSTSFDNSAAFSQYQSFCWLQGCEFSFTGPPHLNDELIMSFIREGILKEMAQKGFRYDEEMPDLLIDFHVTVENRETIVYRLENERFIELDPERDTDVYYFLEGTIVVDIIERESGRMIWRSQVKRYLELNPELTEENFERGLALALKKFPPRN